LENFCVRGFAASPQLYPVGPDWFEKANKYRIEVDFEYKSLMNVY
jgi:hypothetical protein